MERCSSSYAKNGFAGCRRFPAIDEKPETLSTRAKVKAHSWEQKKTYSLFQSNAEGNVARMRKHDMSKHRYHFLRWLKVTPSNNIWGLLWYINTRFFIGDWMLWRNRTSRRGGQVSRPACLGRPRAPWPGSGLSGLSAATCSKLQGWRGGGQVRTD